MSTQTVAFRPFPDRSFTITGNEHDAGVIGELARSGGFYQRDVARFLKRRLPTDAVVVDAGAHIGVLTVLMASLAPRGHVYAFEPAPESHAHLCDNLAANGSANVTPERAAVGDHDGVARFSFNEANPGGSSISVTGDAEVQLLRIDTWAEESGLGRLDLVKLDVEGAELAALAGATHTISRFHPVIVVECNPIALRRFGQRSWRDLAALLRSLYPVVGVMGGGRGPVPLQSLRHLELALGDHGVVDLVALPRRSALDRVTGAARAAAHRARLELAHNRWRPPANNFVPEPDITLRVEPEEMTGPPAATTAVTVTVANHTPWWLSSAFPAHPVYASYRWTDPSGKVLVPEGHRSTFPQPLRPGGRTRLDATVQLPAHPGRYCLVVTLVQERFTWFDDVDPACAARVPATVAAEDSRQP